MRKTYKFRLYPTKPQKRHMERTLELCRYAYNKTLETKKNAYDVNHVTLSKYGLNNLLPEWKKDTPELKEVFSQTLQEVQERVDLAFKHFFRRVKNGENPGYPRFKGYGWYDSFTYPQMGFKLTDNMLYLGKIGNVYMVKHREIDGDVKRVCIRRHNNKWYACLTTESEYHIISSKNNIPAVGIDMGLTSFAVLSDGNTIANPRFFRNEETLLTKAQRKLSTQEKGTPERAKVRKVVRRIHDRIANKRYDFVHQLSRILVKKVRIDSFRRPQHKGNGQKSSSC